MAETMFLHSLVVLGEARLSVEMLRDQKLHDVWLKLQPDSSVTYKKEDVDLESRGHIHLRLRFVFKYKSH